MASLLALRSPRSNDGQTIHVIVRVVFVLPAGHRVLAVEATRRAVVAVGETIAIGAGPVVVPEVIHHPAEPVEAGILTRRAAIVVEFHIGLRVVFHDDRAAAQVRVIGERRAGRAAAVVLDRLHAPHGVVRAAARAIGQMHQPRVGIPHRRGPQTFGVLAAGGRRVVVVADIERVGVLGPFVLLVFLGRLSHVVVLEHQLIDHRAAAHRGVVVTGDLLPQAADVVGRAHPPHGAVHAAAERRHPVVRHAAQLIHVVRVDRSVLVFPVQPIALDVVRVLDPVVRAVGAIAE